MVKLNAKQLRKGEGERGKGESKNELYIILDNVLDTYNVGSIFRLADAVGAKKIFLCGDTSAPPNPRIKKASINTTEWVEWEYVSTTTEAVKNLKSQIKNLTVVAVEQSERSVSYNKFNYKLPLALVVGHETYGVSKEVLEEVDQTVEIPMFGVNISLNVMVSLAIVLYKTLEQNTPL